MGTSKSFSLKSSPNWSSAKRSVTNMINGSGNIASNGTNFMRSFATALGNELYRGSNSRGNSFGHAGTKALTNFVSFISDVRSIGLSNALNFELLDGSRQPKTPKEFIDSIYQHIIGESDSGFDDGAAAESMRKLLVEIFSSCESDEQIEDVLKSADDEQIADWIVIYEVEYILEYAFELFQSHIFSKEGNPEQIKGEIRRWLKGVINERLADDISHVNFFSPEGKAYLDELISKIIGIWGQE